MSVEPKTYAELLVMLAQRDATIAELAKRESAQDVELARLRCELGELRNSALSYQLQRDQANALVKKQEQMLAELRKPVEAERNEKVEAVREDCWLSDSPSWATVEIVLSAYDALALRLADRVRMLGFVQDQLTARNKENEELKERERRLRDALEFYAATKTHGGWWDLDPNGKRTGYVLPIEGDNYGDKARDALAQPQGEQKEPKQYGCPVCKQSGCECTW
jgi:hypothetical protein